MSDAITVSHLSHAYNGPPVLDDVSFKIEQGRFFIIIGPNGSGKSTLLKLLTRLLPLQSGAIDLLAKPIGHYTTRQLARQIAYVPQNVAVEFPFSVTQVVLMGRAPHLGVLGFESPQDHELARKAMEITDVAHLAQRRMDQLSGGEQQRVFIARAICQQPQIILLDEPTAALDLAHQSRVMDLMERLKSDQKVTVIMISHDLNLAAMYADQVLLLSRGGLVRMGAPADVLDFDVLEKVYRCTLLVDQSPLGSYPRVHLVPARYLEAKNKAH
jgi:iron complex transport system ATP-binding protein